MLPLEETRDLIRSGHRSPEEFHSDSVRTIVLSKDEGIKAIIGKPKGKNTMDVQSYLFSKDKGWTVDKAKAWLEKHSQSEAERLCHSYVLSLPVLEKIVDKPLRIRGIAITSGMSRNSNIYTPDELQAFADRLVSAPVYIEHVAVPNAIGKIAKTDWDGQNLWYEAEIYDEETAEKIRKGLVKHVSVGADYEKIDVLNGKIPHGLRNAELSLVAVPGIPETNVQIIEKLNVREQAFEPIIAGEYLLGFYQDVSAFMPEHFSTVWLDKENGVLAIVGRLRTQPEIQRFQSIFFAKEKMWDENKIRDWLIAHPHYMDTTDIAASLQTAVSNHGKGGKGWLAERVWTRKYVNDLPDSAFAILYKEDGRVVRKFPHHSADGRIDLPHLRNANSRLPQSEIPAEQKQKAMRHLATHKKKLGIGGSAEEEKLLETEGEDKTASVELEFTPEPTMDELIASVEDVVGQINDVIDALSVRVEKLEKTVGKETAEGSIVEGIVKNPKTAIPVEEAMRMIQNVLPSPTVERSWGFGPQRLCQELRGVILKLHDKGERE